MKVTGKIHTPNLTVLEYTGDFTKKLFEVRSNKLPILEKGDVVIVDVMAAQSLKRRGYFKEISMDDLFVDESETEKNTQDAELPEPCDKVEQFYKTAIIEVLGRYENGDYQVCNVGNPTDNWRVPKEVFESTYESNGLKCREETQETETQETETQDDGGDESQTQKEVIPFKEDIDSLSEEDIKKWCEHFKVKIGKKQINTLKGLLLPHLPSKED